MLQDDMRYETMRDGARFRIGPTLVPSFTKEERTTSVEHRVDSLAPRRCAVATKQYLDTSKTLMTVPVESSGATFSSRNPIKVFDTKYATIAYDVAPDEKRFLIINENATDDPTRAPAGMVAVLNWTEELKRLVPTR